MPDIEEETIIEEPAASAAADLAPADAPEPAAPENDDDALDFGEGLLDTDNGKILGKFNDTNALARSYKELESHSGRTSGQAAEYRKTLEAAGYTFDASGKAVAPQTAPVAAPAAPAQDPALPAGHKIINGVEHDHLDMVVVSQEEWDALYEEDPAEFDKLQRQQEVMRIVRQERYDAEQGKQQETTYQQAVQNVRVLARDKFFMDDDNITKLEAAAAEVLKSVKPEIRRTPAAYEMAMRAVASDMLPEMYRQQLADVIAGNKEAVARATRVVALEKSTQNAPAPKPAASYGLTAAEQKMAKDLGVSEKDYAANK